MGPCDFGFATFEHGLSGLRFFRVLSALTLEDLQAFMPSAKATLQVKSGSKERAVLDSMTQVFISKYFFRIYREIFIY